MEIQWKTYSPDKLDEIKPGTILLDSSGERLLVGDVNELIGACDCCSLANLITMYSNDLCDQFEKLKNTP